MLWLSLLEMLITVVFLQHLRFWSNKFIKKFCAWKLRTYIKNIALIFSLLKAVFFFLLLCSAIYKMVDSKFNMGIYEYVKISIGTVMGNPEMLSLVPHHLKTKKMCIFKKLMWKN